MKKGVRIVVILAVVLAVLAVGAYFGYTRLSGGEGEGPALGFLPFGKRAGGAPSGAAAGNPEEKFSVPVAVTAAKRESVRETLDLYGSVFAEAEVSILTTVNGKLVRSKSKRGISWRRIRFWP